MSNNVIDGKNLFDGVGQALLAGAIGGALGGAGGALGEAFIAGEGLVQWVLTFGIDVVTNIGGEILSGLAVGTPITLEGVLIGAAIGAGLYFGSAGLGKVREVVSGKADFSTGSRPNTELPTISRPELEVQSSDVLSPQSSGGSTHYDKPEIKNIPGVVVEQKTNDGRQINVLQDGRVVCCSTCDEIQRRYADILQKRPDLEQRLTEIREQPDPNKKAWLTTEFEKKLEKIQGKQKIREENVRPGSTSQSGSASQKTWREDEGVVFDGDLTSGKQKRRRTSEEEVRLSEAERNQLFEDVKGEYWRRGAALIDEEIKKQKASAIEKGESIKEKDKLHKLTRETLEATLRNIDKGGKLTLDQKLALLVEAGSAPKSANSIGYISSKGYNGEGGSYGNTFSKKYWVERNHFPPENFYELYKESYKGSKRAKKLKLPNELTLPDKVADMPAVPMLYFHHRGIKPSITVGGATTTGGQAEREEWVAQLVRIMGGDDKYMERDGFAAAMLKDAHDIMNVTAPYRDFYSKAIGQAAEYAVQQKYMTEEDFSVVFKLRVSALLFCVSFLMKMCQLKSPSWALRHEPI